MIQIPENYFKKIIYIYIMSIILNSCTYSICYTYALNVFEILNINNSL